MFVLIVTPLLSASVRGYAREYRPKMWAMSSAVVSLIHTILFSFLSLFGLTSPMSSVPEPSSSILPSSSSLSDMRNFPFEVIKHERHAEGWAMEFLPGTDYLLISDRSGLLQLRDQTTGELREVSGVPEIFHQSEAGLHDVVAAPSFTQDGGLYVSWVRPHDKGAQGVVGCGHLDTATAQLKDLKVIWEQDPDESDGHFSLRMLLIDGFLYVTSGDRRDFTPAQDVRTNQGKTLRLNLDGTPAVGNPFAGQGGRSAEIWSMGHRNPLGIAADESGRIWASEMGPKGGDELNLIVGGENYGWPNASMGSHYDNQPIPDHGPGDGYQAPAAYWKPAISPANLMIYTGELFPEWKGNAFLGGLSGQTIVRMQLNEDGTATQLDKWDMGQRIRALEQAPDGAIWVMEDKGGYLLELRPR
ncbi:Soluble aldose sugar dehydrogenase YliI precursor [Corynebacterium glaucum]|uniref:Soluble aldose sugar dehydrogenase YliI n=2 Tax=Corynebacterium glaucum TaxID=187491 RepID=A0A1Q2HZJ1_9CORY|nr:Soluble aldose sugar dehydrogenase YliI precursor [Corynebacterium glaucum]